MPHRHAFHALWWNFGRFGPQDVHLHPCKCGFELQGPGRQCDGNYSAHHEIRWNERASKWVEVRKKSAT